MTVEEPSAQHQRAGSTRRPDLTPRAVALRWLDGVPVLDLANEFDTSIETIRRRLKKAREEFPELPWTERKTPRGDTPTVEYITMNDGDPRARALPEGSIIRDRRRRST